MEYNNTSSDMCNGAHTGHQHTQNLIQKHRQRTIYCLRRKTLKPSVHSYFEKGCPQKCARDVPERKYGIWSIHRSRHCSCQHIFFCFPSARANIRPWPLVPFFQISLKNSKLKTTHNTFRDCRVHFFRQPFYETTVYNKWFRLVRGPAATQANYPLPSRISVAILYKLFAYKLGCIERRSRLRHVAMVVNF